MDLTDILGNMLGRKSEGGGRGGDILRDILGGGRERPAPAPSPAPSGSQGDLAAQARELEDLLNVAKGRAARPASPANPGARPTPSPTSRPAPQTAPSQSAPPRTAQPRTSQPAPSRQDEMSRILIRAMLNAAKCDGQITAAEQQAIFDQLGQATPEVVQFLRDECQRPLDVREFAWSVPLGMEAQVYGMSLLVIDAGADREAAYLEDLAHGLRLPPEVRQQLHARYGR